MSASGKTPNFDLPQYKPLDTVSALVTFNGAMGKIDTALQAIKTTADTGSVDIEDLNRSIGEIQTEIAAIKLAVDNMPQSFNWRIPTLNQISGINNLFTTFWTDGHILLLGAAFEYNAQVSVKITMSNVEYIAFYSTPENIFGMADNHYARVWAGYSEKINGGAFTRTWVNVVRQNSITYFCTPAPGADLGNCYLRLNMALPTTLSSTPL